MKSLVSLLPFQSLLSLSSGPCSRPVALGPHMDGDVMFITERADLNLICVPSHQAARRDPP